MKARGILPAKHNRPGPVRGYGGVSCTDRWVGRGSLSWQGRGRGGVPRPGHGYPSPHPSEQTRQNENITFPSYFVRGRQKAFNRRRAEKLLTREEHVNDTVLKDVLFICIQNRTQDYFEHDYQSKFTFTKYAFNGSLFYSYIYTNASSMKLMLCIYRHNFNKTKVPLSKLNTMSVAECWSNGVLISRTTEPDKKWLIHA